MPADYSPAAAAAHAAAVPLSPSLSPSSSPSPPPLPISPTAWDHGSPNSNRIAGSGANRLGRRYSLRSRRSGGSGGLGGGLFGGPRQRGFRGIIAWLYWLLSVILARAITTAKQGAVLFWRLSPLQRVLVVIAFAINTTLGILIMVYNHQIFAALGPMAEGWRAMRFGWLLVWLPTFFTAFPPLIGYSTACSVAGIIYGFPLAWPIVATASVTGSLAAFLASRSVLSGYVNRLVGQDHRFMALGQVLRRDGIWVLTAVRFCPLPYSLSNGFLATVPNVTPAAFALSTALASPKLLVHVFIGSRLAKLAEHGDTMSIGEKAINYAGMIFFGLLGMAGGWLVYRRTMARAAEIEREVAEEEGFAGGDASGVNDPLTSASGGGYADSDELLDPDDADVAALMDDDDISLWAADHFSDGDADIDDAAAIDADNATKFDQSR